MHSAAAHRCPVGFAACRSESHLRCAAYSPRRCLPRRASPPAAAPGPTSRRSPTTSTINPTMTPATTSCVDLTTGPPKPTCLASCAKRKLGRTTSKARRMRTYMPVRPRPSALLLPSHSCPLRPLTEAVLAVKHAVRNSCQPSYDWNQYQKTYDLMKDWAAVWANVRLPFLHLAAAPRRPCRMLCRVGS